MMNVAVVILNYNSASDCRKCIGFLKKQEGVGAEIIVVDNCSPREGEQESIRSLCEELHCTFIPATENRGYNAGNNIGLRYAAEKGYKYALIANPDMEFPQTDYLKKMVEVMERDDSVAVCGSNILGLDGKEQNPKRFTQYYEELFWFFGRSIRKVLKTPLIVDMNSGSCDMVSGCCMLLRMDTILQMNFLDDKVFMYCEEPILGKQIRKMGMNIYYCKEAVATHAHVSSQKGPFMKRFNLYWKSRSYYLKNYSGYSKCQSLLISLSRDVQYIFKCLQIKLWCLR
jgi:GT2 family glycosyltransferase